MLRRLLVGLLLVPCLGFEWPGEVYRLNLEIEHSEPAQRRELVRRLAQHSASAAKEPLLHALEDADLQVRIEAAAVAGRVRLREAVPILLDWLDDKEAETRRAAAAALGQIGEPRALPPLTRALGDAAAEVRRAAVVALGALASPDALVPLMGRLEDVDISVRLEAITALATLRDARAVVPLLGAAADPSAEVRASALAALGRIADPRALPALSRALADEVESVQLAAAAAIGQIGDPAGVRALKARLERAELRLGQAILAALGNIDDPAARALLVQQLATPALRRSAQQALVRQAQRLANLPPAAPARPSDKPQPAPAAALVAALGKALEASSDLPVRLALADALAQVAEVAPIDAALPALLSALGAAEGELGATLMRALGASGSPQALVPLLEQLGQAQGDALEPALTGLRLYFERSEPDGRAADPLLERLPAAGGPERVAIVELLGRVGAPRALPALVPLFAHEDAALRVAALRAAGALAAPEAAGALLPLLDSADATIRFEAARALRDCADAAALRTLLARLAGPTAVDRHALLIALGGGLARVAKHGGVPAPLAKQARDSLLAIARGDDDALSDRAVDAIGVWGPPEALELIATNLRSPSSRRRALATHTIGLLGGQKPRHMLRFLLTGGTPREAAAAASGLAELGDERDLSALIKVSRRRHWPVPGAAAFALSRIAARGALRPHATARTLCELAGSREPYVRANVAAAMAALGIGACEADGPDPLQWLEPPHAPIVRAAAARWAHAAARAGRLDAARVADALERCAALDVEQSVRSVCAAPAATAPSEATDVYAYAPDGVTLLRDRLIALRFSDGTVFLGFTDRNGHVRLKAAPRGPVRLEDPALTPLEPPN